MSGNAINNTSYFADHEKGVVKEEKSTIPNQREAHHSCHKQSNLLMLNRNNNSYSNGTTEVRLELKIFRSRWKELRYPKVNIKDIRKAYGQAPTLMSLVAKDDSGVEIAGDGEVRVCSQKWKDSSGCCWRVCVFPLGKVDQGKVDQENVAIYLEKSAHNSEQDVHVEFRLHSQNYDSHNQPPPPLVTSFQHSYPNDISSFGLDKAFTKTNFLREFVSSDGFIVLTVIIHHAGSPSEGHDSFEDNQIDFSKKNLFVENDSHVTWENGNNREGYHDWGEGDSSCSGDGKGWVGNAPESTNWNSWRTKRPRDDECPYAGLLNQGATCYMNALLQVWFHLPVFRDLVLKLPLPQDDDDHNSDTSCCSHQNPFEYTAHSENESLDETINSATMCTEGRSSEKNSPSPLDVRVGHALKHVFAQLAEAGTKSSSAWRRRRNGVPTLALTDSFGWGRASLYRQHDVQELSRVLLDRLDSVFRDVNVSTPKKSKELFPYLFEGKIESFIRCTSVSYASARVETFLDLALQVKDCSSLYDSLRQFTHEEDLVGENQYDASDVGFGKQNAKKGVKIHTLPPVLNIHLKRFEFDMGTMSGMAKVNDRFEFPLLIDMKGFVIEKQDGTENDEAKDERRDVYHLHSIVLHGGDVGGGHYTAYIRPKLDSYDIPLQGGTSQENERRNKRDWYQFDDEFVSLVDEDEMLETAYGALVQFHHFQEQSRTSAYMLSYVRESDLGWVLGDKSEESFEGPTSKGSQTVKCHTEKTPPADESNVDQENKCGTDSTSIPD